MTNGLFITLILWLAGSVILLWQASIAVMKHNIIWVFLPFFIAVMVMDATAAFIYYGVWTTGIWTVFRFLWLLSFLFFLVVWIWFMIKFLRE